MEVSKQFVEAVKELGKNGFVYTVVTEQKIRPEFKDSKNTKLKGAHTLAAKTYQSYEALLISLVVESFINDNMVCPISIEHDGLLLASVSKITAEKEIEIISRAIAIVSDQIGIDIGLELVPSFVEHTTPQFVKIKKKHKKQRPKRPFFDFVLKTQGKVKKKWTFMYLIENSKT